MGIAEWCGSASDADGIADATYVRPSRFDEAGALSYSAVQLP
jgi:hypothetical protein